MDNSHEQYSIGEPTAAHADKTSGGVSKLAGLTFGTDEDSFHSDEFDRELGNALGRNKHNKPSLNLGAPPNRTPDHSASADTADTFDDTDGIVDELGSYIKSKPGRNTLPTTTTTAPHSLRQPKPSSRLSARTPLTRADSPASSRQSPNPKQKPPDIISSRFHPPRSMPAQLPGDDSTLNDSAAFALSPPTSPEISRGNSAAGPSNQAGLPKKSAAGRRGPNGEPIRAKGNHLTLREQEKVIDEVKKENFNLKLKIYFLEDRLAKLAPDQVDLALKENVEIKVEFQTVRQELKRYKRLLLEAERAIELTKAERDELQQQSAKSERWASSGLEAELRKLKDELAAKTKLAKELDAELRRSRDRLERLSSKENAVSVVTASQKEDKSYRRPANRPQSIDDWANEEHLLEIKNLKSELTEERQLKEDLLGDNHDLRHRLIETKNALQDSQDEIHRMSRIEENGYRSTQISRAQSRLDDLDDYHSRKSTITPISTVASSHKLNKDLRRDLDELHKHLGDLEGENVDLRSQINAQATMLSSRNAEKDKLQEQVGSLKRKVMELEDELDQGDREFEHLQRSDTNQGAADGLRDELNMYRDKLSSALLTLEKREKEIDELTAELQERDSLFSQQVDKVAQEYAEELDSVKAQRDELQDHMDEREDQIEELSEQLREVINLQEETDKSLREMSARLQHKEEDYNAVVKELEATQADLKEIGAGNRELAVEVNEKEQQISNLNADLDELEQEAANRATVHEQVVAKLKQKLSTTKAELSELRQQHESCLSELKSLGEKHEQLALRHAEIDERRRNEADAKRRLEREIDEVERELRGTREEMELQIIATKKEKRELQGSFQQALEAKQKLLSHAESDLAHVKGRLQVREEDLEKLQSVLKQLETESNRLNQSQSHDRFSLELEIERLHRDLASSTKELEHAKAENEQVRNSLREVSATVAGLNSERDELNDKLEGVQRARKELGDKFEDQTKNLRQAQADLASTKNRLQTLEDELSQEHKQLSKTENQYREQLSERNTLLLTIYQFVDKLVNSGARKVGSSHVDAKPFTNFGVFHESVISRLKSLSAMQSGFETKIKEVESKLEKQYAALKRQHDSRMRQLDQFETTIKAAADTQRQWRARLATKQGEVEAARATCHELQQQIGALKQRASLAGQTPGSVTEQRQTLGRVSHLEKRLLATQTQLKATEEKFAEAKTKVGAVEASWQARLKELQERNKELEEKVKRERQGARERKNELDSQVASLKDQVEASERRGKLLEGLVQKNGAQEAGKPATTTNVAPGS